MKKLLLICTMVMGLPLLGQTKLNIVTTTTDLASIAQAVGGEHVTVNSLQKGKRDPHFLQAKPSYIMKAKKADLWIRIGMELEIGYESVILEASRNPKIRPGQPGHLDVSQAVEKLDIPQGKIDRSMGDVHREGNPHYWLDPYNGRLMAQAIGKRLKLLEPSHRQDYEQLVQAFIQKIDQAVFGKALVDAIGSQPLWEAELAGQLDQLLVDQGSNLQLGGMKAKLQPYLQAQILTFHASWIYFLERFNLNLAGELEPKPGIPPAPGDLAKAIKTIKEKQVKVILIETYYPKKSADFVADKTNAQVAVVAQSVGGQKEASDYISLVENVVNRIVMVMEKK